MKAVKIVSATRLFESWLAGQTTLVRADLAVKHRRMSQDVFSFFRATCYRWAQLWPHICGELHAAPTVLAVGDLHVENFGTWRDQDGRLIWGINDFDETHPLPYTNDLVRLTASAMMATEAHHLALTRKQACDAILTGYVEGVRSGGRPFVLEERHRWLRAMVMNDSRDPVKFWEKMNALPKANGPVPQEAKRALESLLPEQRLAYSVRRRTSGIGSLGRPRFVALVDWQGGRVARETKVLIPSAWVWARGNRGARTILYQDLLNRAVRCGDPEVRVRGTWLVRRLSPSCSRIELAALSKKRDEGQLLYAMGWETANVHLGSPRTIKSVQQDLAQRKSKWLRNAVKAMVQAVMEDWREWKS